MLLVYVHQFHQELSASYRVAPKGYLRGTDLLSKLPNLLLKGVFHKWIFEWNLRGYPLRQCLRFLRALSNDILRSKVGPVVQRLLKFTVLLVFRDLAASNGILLWKAEFERPQYQKTEKWVWMDLIWPKNCWCAWTFILAALAQVHPHPLQGVSLRLKYWQLILHLKTG